MGALQGWKNKKLGDICENLDSKRIPITKGKRKKGEIPYYGASGVVDYVEGHLFDTDLLLVSEDGANLLARTYPIAFSVTGKIWVNNHAHVLKFKYWATQKYLEYYLNSISLTPYINGMAQPKLNQKSLNSIPIPFPPLQEQQHIVNILDDTFARIDTAIANTKQNMANAKELFDSYLNSVFEQKGENQSKKLLKEIASDFGRGKSKHRPRNDKKLYGGSYPFIQTGDVRNSCHIIETYTQTYNDVGLAQSKLWPKGTICITIAANIAETGVLGFDACFPDSIIGIVVDDEKAINKYVEYLLQSAKIEIQKAGKGSAQDNINLRTFENYLFFFPSILEQERIVARLDALSKHCNELEAKYKSKLSSLQELKQSILEKAFSGELTAEMNFDEITV